MVLLSTKMFDFLQVGHFIGKEHRGVEFPCIS